MNKIKFAVIILLIGGMIMSYTRVNWQNAPSTATPVNAENLNTMDKGIADAHSQLASTVKKVNGELPDETGNVVIEIPDPDLSAYATKAEVDAQISSLGDASPKGVYATLSALQAAYPTGASGIYVVAADGNWYYWNGSAWTAGGIYQSSGIADDSIGARKLPVGLTEALVGQTELRSSWEIGALNSDGEPSDATTRIRTKEVIMPTKDVEIILLNTVNYKYLVFYYDSEGVYINRNTGWLTRNKFWLSRCYKYKILMAKSDDSVITDMSLLANNIIVREVAKINAPQVDIPWQSGTLYADGSQLISTLVSPTRMTTFDLHYADSDIILTTDSNKYKFGIVYFNSAGDTALSANIWMSYDEYIIPSGSYFKLLAANVDDSAIDVWEFAKAFTFIKKPKYVMTSVDHIPDYWVSHLNSKINTIKTLQLSNGNNKFSFAVIADLHWEQNYKKSPALLKKVVNDCDINCIIQPGDFTIDNIAKDVALIKIREMMSIFKSVGALFMPTMGNHDDNSYNASSSLNMKLSNTITKGEQYSEVFRQLGNNVTYGETGTYYYWDDNFHKIRIISIDCLDMSYEDDGTGKMVYKTFGYRQAQLTWLCEKALNTPDNTWQVVVFTHGSPFTNIEMPGNGTPPINSDIVMDILGAFKAKTSYTNTVVNNNDFDVTINADFTGKGGDVIALVCGHTHNDYILKWNNDIQVVTTLNDGYHFTGVGDAPEKVAGTTTEQAFDIFTVDKSTRTVNITRIGAGSDRSFIY